MIAALVASASVCLGASTASAGVEGEDVSLTLDPASVGTDSLFSAVLTGCVDGQNVSFILMPGDSKTSPCVGDAANAEFLSPEDPGTYTVSGEVLETAAMATAQLTVVASDVAAPEVTAPEVTAPQVTTPRATTPRVTSPSVATGQLPATGPVSGPAVPLAVVAIAVGLGLVGVARLRR